MPTPIEFEGCNTNLGAPAGHESAVRPLPCFRNGQVVVSCWQLTPEELENVVASGGKVFLSIWGGRSQPPCFVGDEASVLAVVTQGVDGEGAPGWK